MSTLLFIFWGWISSIYIRRTVEKKSSPASDKNLSNSLQMPTRHSKEREEPGMVFSRGKSIIFFAKEFMRKIHKRESTRRFLTASRTMKYFMRASCNPSGRKNGAKIWITSQQSIFRTKPLQNNWNDTLRCIIFGTIPNKWRGPTKAVQITITLHGLSSGWTKKQVRLRNQKRRQNYREDLDPEKLDWFVWLSHTWKWYFAVNRTLA